MTVLWVATMEMIEYLNWTQRVLNQGDAGGGSTDATDPDKRPLNASGQTDMLGLETIVSSLAYGSTLSRRQSEVIKRFGMEKFQGVH